MKRMKFLFDKMAKEFVAAFGLVLTILIFAVLTGGRNLQINNVQIVVVQSLVTLVSAIGAIFVFATGNWDLSIGGIVGICSPIAWLIGGESAIVIFLVGVIVGALCSSIVGFLINYLHVPGLFVGIVMMSIGKCFVTLLATRIKMVVPSSVLTLNNFYFYVVIAVLVVILGYFVLNRTQAGLFMKAIGANSMAANLSGVNTKKYAMYAFMLTGASCGIAAFMRMLRAGAVTATSGLGVELDVILALIIGGIPVTGGMRTKIRNAVIGVIFMNVLSNGFIMMGLPYNMINLCKGVILLVSSWISMDRKRKDAIV